MGIINHSPVWPIIIITVRSALDASHIVFLYIQWKCAGRCAMCISTAKRRKKEATLDTHGHEMVPMASNTALELNTRIQKALEEKGINRCAIEKYIKEYRNTSSTSADRPSFFAP